MALLRSTSHILPSLVTQVVRSSPILLSSVYSVLKCNASSPYLQKRNLGIVGLVLQGTIDVTVISTGIAGIRRMTGYDCRQFADTLQNTTHRRYIYNYLDFGERCADKLSCWCGNDKPKASYNTYYEKYGYPPNQSNNRIEPHVHSQDHDLK